MAIRRYLRNHGPFDIIHGHSSKGGAVARLAAIGAGMPAIYTPHALIMMSPDLPIASRLFYSSIEFLLSKISSRIIAVSPAEARLAVKTRMGAARIVTIPNGVGPPQLAPRDQARQRCGALENDIVIGSVGRLVENKGCDVMVKALAVALKTNPRLRVVFVGDGPCRTPLTELAVSLGIARRVVLLGEVNARDVFAGFDIFGISSRMEAMPYVVLEALAAGLPIVATDTSGVEMLVEDESNGKVVPMDDHEGFAAALVKVAGNPALMSTMGRDSLKRVAPLSSERMIDRIVELYETCIGEEASAKLARVDDDEPQLAGELE